MRTNFVSSLSDPSAKRSSRRERVCGCLRRFLLLLVSTGGLSAAFVSYSVLGGYLFMRLESPNEARVKDAMRERILDRVQELWLTTASMNVLHPYNWTAVAEDILVNFTQEVFLATKVNGWDGTKSAEQELQWSFAGSLLYSVTVITTIGYGHIAPKTDAGKVVTILYAVFGIPLTMMTLTNLGSFMAVLFRFVYRKLFCACACRRRCDQTDDVTSAKFDDDDVSARRDVTVSGDLDSDDVFGAGGTEFRSGDESRFHTRESSLRPKEEEEVLEFQKRKSCLEYLNDNNGRSEALRIGEISKLRHKSDSSLLDASKAKNRPVIFRRKDSDNTAGTPGMAIQLTAIEALPKIVVMKKAMPSNETQMTKSSTADTYKSDNVNRENETENETETENESKAAESSAPITDARSSDNIIGERALTSLTSDPEFKRRRRRRLESVRSRLTKWKRGVSGVLYADDNRAFKVPIYVSVIVIVVYVIAGSLLFTLWERDWSYLEGCYFCFITLSTIGFGDYVPGTSGYDWEPQNKLVLCALYLVFGLALIAMCFDLMQEEVRAKFKTFARTIGLTKD